MDLSAGGSGLRVDGREHPDLRRGVVVYLLFETLVLLKPIRLTARVVRVEPGDGDVLYGLEFTDMSELNRQIPFVLRKEFNRRATPRSRPDDLIEVLLESEDGQEQARARMVDISTGGLGLSLGATEQGKFTSVEEVVVSFHLPGNATKLSFAGRVRGRRVRGAGTLLNIQFDPRTTTDYEWQRSMLEEYVAERLIRSWEVRRH